ncbi:acyl-CoA thioesterase [Spirillospora sp. CA-294931]|uniref:acyl-CoA thioesterase n=1 Tax=Spirillospora sp. CA-294931 TaxID=3240042 RepID=UPI003D8E6430
MERVSVSRVRVKPRHCDAQSMVHAIRYYEFFEDAFLDWLDRFAGGYAGVRASGADLVIVENGCEYRGSARLDDLLAVETRPARIGNRSLTMAFIVRRDEETVAEARATYVAVADGRSVPLPAPLSAAPGQQPDV